MVRNTTLWEVVSTDFLGTVARTDLASSGISFRIMCFLALKVIQLGTQKRKSFILVLDLGLLGLAINYDTCRVMCKTNGRVGCVNALSTVT